MAISGTDKSGGNAGNLKSRHETGDGRLCYYFPSYFAWIWVVW
jgi:hypothetical protein